MKNKNKTIIRIVAASTISFAIIGGYYLANSIKNGMGIQKTVASEYETNTVPTTIDLNDTTEANKRSYYSALNDLSTSDRQGTNLLKNLKPILKNGQKYFSYGSSGTTAVWQAYEITDRDWEKSPASKIDGYNANTGIITGYTYGESNSKPGSNPYIHALYVNRNADNQTQAWGDHTQTNYGFQQEHVWAKAHGFEDTSKKTGARGDLMHLMAGNGRVNGATGHSNYYYGYVDKTQTYTDGGNTYSYLSGNLQGFSKTLGGSIKVFEPQDDDKGNIARALFYMVARYNYLSGSDSDGIDAGNPNLELINTISGWSQSGYTSSTTTTGKMAILQDLLEWNRLDPPDEYEIHRNNLLYTNFTNNRNPFIDFPEWAEFIWGKSTNGHYSSTPTGYAQPLNDNISDFGSKTGITSISKTQASMVKNGTTTISATSSNGANISWSSSNTSVVTVSSASAASGASITLTAKATGSATITASVTIDGDTYTDTCAVTVYNTKALSSITISGPTTAFSLNDTFSFGGTVYAHYNDDTSVDVTSSATFAGYDMSTAGTYTVTVSYTDLGTTKTATYQIVVASTTPVETETASAAISDIATTNNWTVASGTGTQTCYTSFALDSVITISTTGTANCGSYWTTSGAEGWRLYQNKGGNIIITAASGYELDSATLTFTNSNSGVLLNANSVQVSSNVAQNISGSTYTFTVSASSGSTGQIRLTAISVSYHSTASAKVLSSISLDIENVQTEFTEGDTFDYNGLLVTAYYTNDTSAPVIPTSVSTPDMSTVGTKTVTVTYTESGVTRTATYQIEVVHETATSITATVSKTYFVGDTISKSDITVQGNTGEYFTDFSFTSDGYRFTYADAASGGELTNKTFTNAVSSNGLTCSLTVQVQRKARTTIGSVSDTLDKAATGNPSSYSSWSGVTGSSTAVYAGHSSGGNDSIQLRTTKTDSLYNSGIVSTSSGGEIKTVTVNWYSGSSSERTLSVYGKNTAYSTPNDLFSSDESTKGTLLGTIEFSTNAVTLNIEGSYNYVGVRSTDGAIYISSITFSYSASDTAKNVANYIMYEDTNGQCNTKFAIAKGYFEGLTSTERATFMTSSDYVIAQARERFEAWAAALGKTITYSGGDYVISSNTIRIGQVFDTRNIAIIVIFVSFSAVGAACYFGFRKRRNEK